MVGEGIDLVLDEEVFAIILAISIIASALGIALTLRPMVSEPFTAIGLLNEDCRIGEYPKRIVNGSSLRLCIYVANYLGYPAYFKIVYRIATNRSLPNTTTPSPKPILVEWRTVLGNEEEKKFPTAVPVYRVGNETRIALVFELWVFDTDKNLWVYTGRWTHLYIDVEV